MTIQCFNAIPVEPYLHFMSDKLQRKRTEATYGHRESNKRVRRKEDECVWKNDKIRNMVEKILIQKYDYFSFCKECLGSENDLLYVHGGDRK